MQTKLMEACHRIAASLDEDGEDGENGEDDDDDGMPAKPSRNLKIW